MIRDVFAGVIALILLYVAIRLATTLTAYRQERQRARDSERALGRRLIAEIPGDEGLMLFSEDSVRFHYGERSIDKDLIAAVRVLINGAPIAGYVSRRYPAAQSRQPTTFDDRVEGIARDRWDVAIESINNDTVIVACGAIRERVSQELARAVFEAVKRELERRDHHSTS